MFSENKRREGQRSGSLKAMVDTMLLRRMVAVTLVVAGVMSYFAYLHARMMVRNTVVQVSMERMNTVIGRFREVMSGPGSDLNTALSSAVNYPPDSDIHFSEGKFLYVLLHDRKQTSMGVFRHPGRKADIQAIEGHLAAGPTDRELPGRNHPQMHFATIGGQDYLDIHAALGEEASGGGLFFRAFFLLSPSAKKSFAGFTLRTTLFVNLVILATILLLYPVVLFLVRRITAYSDQLLIAHLETMEALGEAIAHRDQETGYHNYRVTIYTVSLAEHAGVAGQEMGNYIKGAYLHDIGKIGIRDALLLSPEKYSAENREAMKSHVNYGLDIIGRSTWLKDAAEIVGGHHERYDGSGYPLGLKGEEIPRAARIFALADVFDALTSARPYRKPLPLAEVIAHLDKGRGAHFDPVLLDLFLGLVEQLYQRYGGREDELLKREYRRLIDRYFLARRPRV